MTVCMYMCMQRHRRGPQREIIFFITFKKQCVSSLIPRTYVYMCVYEPCMHTCTHTSVHVCMYVHVHVYVLVSIHQKYTLILQDFAECTCLGDTCVYVSSYVHNIGTYICMYVYVCIYMCIYTYIYKERSTRQLSYIHTNTHTHAYKERSTPMCTRRHSTHTHIFT
jgi:hypothetical protein